MEKSKKPLFRFEFDPQTVRIFLADSIYEKFGEILPKMHSYKGLNSKDRAVLFSLETLACDSRVSIEKDERSLSITWTDFYSLMQEAENDEGAFMHDLTPYLPMSDKTPKVELKSNSVIGKADFTLSATVQDAVDIAGGMITFRDGRVGLLTPGQFELFTKARQFNLKRANTNTFDLAEQMRAWSNVVSSIPPTGAVLDKYLSNETNYVFLDKIQVDIELNKETGGVELSPLVSEKTVDPEEFKEKFDQLPEIPPKYDFDLPNGKRTRIVPDADVAETLSAIKKKSNYTKSEIPELLDPENSPIPNLDQFGFSKRVKGIGVFVYKPVPYLEIKEKDEQGWFDVAPGVRLEGLDICPKDEVDLESRSLAADEVQTEIFRNETELEKAKELVKEARMKGLSHFEIKPDHFVPIEEFEQQLPKIEEALKIDPSTDKKKKLQLVLQIYENVTDLEYSEVDGLFEPPASMPHGMNPPPGLAKDYSLRDYQIEAYDWLYWLSRQESKPLRGALLADDMGLGKSLTVLSFLSLLHHEDRLRPSLIVVPKILIENWMHEARKFYPALSRVMHDLQSLPKDAEYVAGCDLVITNYEQVSNNATFLGKIPWKTIVVDEAQRIKNAATKTSCNMKGLKAETRVAMTGTPIENTLGELWNIMDWVQPGKLSSFKEFRKQFNSVSNDPEKMKGLKEELERQMEGCFKRRLKSSLEEFQKLPKNFIPHKVPMSQRQAALYMSTLADYRAEAGGGKKALALQALHKLRQISIHPALLSEEPSEGDFQSSAKIVKILEILKDIKVKNEKVLIFAHTHKAEQLLHSAIAEKLGVSAVIVNGETKNKHKLIDEFEAKNGFDILILGLRACGYGLTITAANHVIHFERWWNPAVEDQANCRVYRIGQKRPVTVHHIITQRPDGKMSFDEKLDAIHRRKLALADNFLTPATINMEDELAHEVLDEDED